MTYEFFSSSRHVNVKQIICVYCISWWLSYFFIVSSYTPRNIRVVMVILWRTRQRSHAALTVRMVKKKSRILIAGTFAEWLRELMMILNVNSNRAVQQDPSKNFSAKRGQRQSYFESKTIWVQLIEETSASHLRSTAYCVWFGRISRKLTSCVIYINICLWFKICIDT